MKAMPKLSYEPGGQRKMRIGKIKHLWLKDWSRQCLTVTSTTQQIIAH